MCWPALIVTYSFGGHSLSAGDLPFSECFDSAKKHVRRDVKGRSVLAPRAVGGRFAGVDRAEMFGIGRKNQYTAGTGRPKISFYIDFQSIRQALATFHQVRGIDENSAVLKQSLFVDVIRPDIRSLRIGDGNV